MDQNTKTSRIFLFQDLGILLFMVAVLAASLITALSGSPLLYQHVALMMAIMLLAVLLLGVWILGWI